jgi:hypothetical protein
MPNGEPDPLWWWRQNHRPWIPTPQEMDEASERLAEHLSQLRFKDTLALVPPLSEEPRRRPQLVPAAAFVAGLGLGLASRFIRR